MTTLTTLPERLVEAIKQLVASHDRFRHEIEELQALSDQVQVQIDRLVVRKESLASISPGDRKPVALPRAVLPQEREPDSAA